MLILFSLPQSIFVPGYSGCQHWKDDDIMVVMVIWWTGASEVLTTLCSDSSLLAHYTRLVTSQVISWNLVLIAAQCYSNIFTARQKYVHFSSFRTFKIKRTSRSPSYQSYQTFDTPTNSGVGPQAGGYVKTLILEENDHLLSDSPIKTYEG